MAIGNTSMASINPTEKAFTALGKILRAGMARPSMHSVIETIGRSY